MITALVTTREQAWSPAEQHRVGRRLLHQALRERCGPSVAASRVVATAGGKPVLARYPQVHFNISHCAGAVAVVIADQPVGVDVESVRPHDGFAARRVLHPEEIRWVAGAADPDREFFRCWTVKESYVKALGVGLLSYPARELVVRRLGGTAELELPDGRCALDEDVAGHVVATCLLGTDSPWPPRFERVRYDDECKGT